MFVLEIYGESYDNAFEYHYYSNSLEELKTRGVEELILDLNALGFVIKEVLLEEKNIVSNLDIKVVSTSSHIPEDEINFRRLEMILTQEKAEDFVFKCDGRYYNDDRPYDVEVKKSDDKITLVKVDSEEDETLDFDEYSITNCHGIFVEQVIYDYHMYCEYKDYED